MKISVRGGLSGVALLATLALCASATPALAQASVPRPVGPELASARPPREACPLPQGDSGEELALVLSGGGARGLAHIGVLRVLDSLDIRPTIVVGTSMGALVGALYAGGMSGAEMDSLARTLPFESLFRRYSPMASLSTGDFDQALQVRTPLFVVEERGSVRRLQSPVARESRINALFNQLFLRANLTAAGDFDRLPRRFRAVATDLHSRSAVVMRSGDLAEAVRASVSIPVVFAPLQREGRTLLDGGLTDNVPVDVARRMGADRVIVSEVSQHQVDETTGLTTGSMLGYLLDELFRQPLDSLGPHDFRLHPQLEGFGPLAFDRRSVGPLVRQGYDAAVKGLATCAPPGRSAPGPQLPAERVAGSDVIAERLARLADEGVFEAVWLNPYLAGASDSPADSAAASRDRLSFAPVAIPSPRRIGAVGLAYDGHEGARAWISATDAASADDRLAFTGLLTLGEYTQQLVITASAVRRHPLRPPGSEPPDDRGARMILPDPRTDAAPWSTLVSNLLRPEMSVTATRRIVELHSGDGRRLDRPATRDVVVLAGFGATPSVGRRIAIGPALHLWSTRAAALDRNDRGRSAGAMLRAANIFSAPAVGPHPYRLPMAAVEAFWMDRYYRAGVEADLHVQVGDVTLRPRGALGWGEELPLAAQYTLGGNRGFPGLQVHERRGNRVGYAALQAAHPIVGALHATLEFGAGFTSAARSRLPLLMDGAATGNVFGGDLGLAASTPLGPLSISYGIASNDRPVFKLRLGDW